MSAVQPVLLAMDVALWTLVGALALFLWRARRREHYRRAWKQLLGSRVARICLWILGGYAAVALLDSVHFRKAMRDASGGVVRDDRGGALFQTETLSLLDVFLRDLKSRPEKTYSAPFAARLWTSDWVERPDGVQVREFPRLDHGGAHLADPRDAPADIAGLAALGALKGTALAAVLLAAWSATLWLRTRKRRVGAVLAEALRGIAVPAVLLILGAAVAALASHYHVLGTGRVGQDVLYLALKGCRTGLIVGTVTTLVATPFAAAFGIAAGYFGGRVDDIIQYLYTTISSIPGILLISAAMLILNAGLSGEASVVVADRRLLWLCVILGVVGWTGLCRLLRGETLKIRDMDYVQAAHASGISHAGIMFRHILPNVTHLVLISVVLRFSGLVLAEAVLAYVGIGVDPSTQSWGNMINAARGEVSRDPVVWWNLAAAFVFMFGLVLPANLFGDAVRDALDPRLRTE